MTFISTLLKAAAALFMLVILMLLVQLDLTAFQTVEVLAPGWGWLAFVSLLALETGAVLWLGLAWFARAPRLVLRDDPTEAERQAFALQLLLQVGIILYYAVMDYRKIFRFRIMRMRVYR